MSNDFFRSEVINKNIHRIISITGEYMFLIEGNEIALLVDTSVGCQNLKEYVKSITSKQIIVVLTHGHVDHAMGCGYFDNVYMSYNDLSVFNAHNKLSVKKGYFAAVAPHCSVPDDESFCKNSDTNINHLFDGMVFNLGNLNIEVIASPGHTLGSMSLLIREEKILILGDSCNNFTFVFDDDSLSVEDYKTSLEEFNIKTLGKYSTVLFSHGDKEKKFFNVIESVIQVCDDILNNIGDNIPFEFMGYKALIAKNIDHKMSRLDGGFGNIVYNPKKIYSRGKKV